MKPRKILIGWSGLQSLRAAERLYEFLLLVLHGWEPWLSVENLRKGAWWQSEFAKALKPAAGIFCVTPEAMRSHWVSFEAGAVAMSAGDTAVCLWLLGGVKKIDLDLPLSMFQSAVANRADTWRMISDLNSLHPSPMPEKTLTTLFNTFWPQLKPNGNGRPPRS